MAKILSLPQIPLSPIRATIKLPASKSLSNRYLILRQIFPNLNLKNLSTAADTQVLQNALSNPTNEINVGHAGTAYRFLAAYYATRPGIVTLSGSDRMHQRPIGPLVEALTQLGAKITYTEKTGFPPLKIEGTKTPSKHVKVEAGISSQFVSALLLVAAGLPQGLKITLTGDVVSAPYIALTLHCLAQCGVSYEKRERNILIFSKSKTPKQNPEITIENDWSSAAFWYALAATRPGSEILLPGLVATSPQGDRALIKLFKPLGVISSQTESGILLRTKTKATSIAPLRANLNPVPDLAQALVVACVAQERSFHFEGLQTLRIKETDRLQALKNEFEKIGVAVHISNDAIWCENPLPKPPLHPFETYEDHRMAMSLAVLSALFPIQIKNPEVVVKSYPGFWEAFKA